MLVFRGSVALFVVVGGLAVAAAGWQAFYAGPGKDSSRGTVARQDHPPAGEGRMTGDRLVTSRSEGAPVAPVAAKQEGTSTDIPPIPDIDATGWFDITAVTGPEEPIAVVLAVGPRAQPRPDVAEKRVVAGIPIEPEPPVGGPARNPPWLANAVRVPQIGNRPMIAIVIDDAGIARERTRRASRLPAPLTIAFISYAGDLERQTRYARARGHELLVHLPMEPSSDAVDPGRNALLTSLSRQEIMRRFRWALDRFDGYVGVNNHMGSKFMARPDLVGPVLEEINARGLLFLDSRTDHLSVGTKLARDMAMPHATRNVFLDNELDAPAIREQLRQVESVARRSGYAIAIGHPHDVTVDVLAKWIPEARRRGFALVPVSAIVKKEYEEMRLASAAAGGEADGLLGGAQ